MACNTTSHGGHDANAAKPGFARVQLERVPYSLTDFLPLCSKTSGGWLGHICRIDQIRQLALYQATVNSAGASTVYILAKLTIAAD